MSKFVRFMENLQLGPQYVMWNAKLGIGLIGAMLAPWLLLSIMTAAFPASWTAAPVVGRTMGVLLAFTVLPGVVLFAFGVVALAVAGVTGFFWWAWNRRKGS
ncbi:MAG: hypothetical protein AVDCRST_MAG15-1712 [uncultured Rubellimicrobium sp.]|uniref:Uncharacterized protein n=1 Tax=uncultured Rubellimicrobium sp. TaxID=543078 RepID=A0A6J4PG90_9RHOB|nr:MAG: hypothetical protein AVDCRST_MAG15-1712 [uncultured Rubellimicrobium sp.]